MPLGSQDLGRRKTGARTQARTPAHAITNPPVLAKAGTFRRAVGAPGRKNMHIEPGVVDGAKIVLSYGTAAACLGMAVRSGLQAVRQDGLSPIAARTLIATLMVFSFFEVLPHHPVGVSEVHLILGSTLFLMFGLAPAAFGLAFGLGIQGLFFAPQDLPQYGMNVTTLLAALFAMQLVARKVIPDQIAYKDVSYGQALALSTAYQGGIVAWVAFWAFYGQGFGAENLAEVASFGGAYLSVILVEPLIDLAILAGAKALSGLADSKMVNERLYRPAV